MQNMQDMQKVFIADDEKWIVESLKSSINWNKHGFEVIGQAYNGVQALKQILQMKPDVVFTDIRMPGVNGLELIKKVRDETDQDVQFIIVSGYAEFAYAQKAINSGAVGYCLKPFDNNEIINLLNKIKQNKKMAKSAKEINLIDLLEGIEEKKQSQISDLFMGAGVCLNEKEGLLVLESIGTRDLEFPSDMKYVKFKTSVKKTAYLVNNTNSAYIKDYFSKQNLDEILSIGIGAIIKNIGDINTAIENTDIAAYQFFITQQTGVYEVSLLNTGDICDILKELRGAVHQKDTASIDRIFNKVEEGFAKGKYNIKHAFRFYNSTMSYLDRLIDESTEDYIYNYDQLVESFDNIGEALRFLKELVIKQFTVDFDHKLGDVENKTFKCILQFINDSFYKNITIQSLSQKFFVNPSYLCQLFKKEVGKTFTEYVSTLRINRACELLMDSELPIHSIGEKVGYEDYFYFSKIFKKITSKSPTQYREHHVNV